MKKILPIIICSLLALLAILAVIHVLLIAESQRTDVQIRQNAVKI